MLLGDLGVGGEFCIHSGSDYLLEISLPGFVSELKPEALEILWFLFRML